MRNSEPVERREIICYFAEHFQAAFAVTSKLAIESRPIIRTAPGAADYAGVQFLWDLIKMVPAQSEKYREVVLDCGENPATVFGALRTGWKKVGFTGPPKLRGKVASLLSNYGGEVVVLDEGPVLDLRSSADPATDCVVWLEGLRK
ncbi:MAG: hypothetical protein VX884_03105 [Pseudomonadota bacterium]|nr:hypothetical protein [Pseudomonadota bacterium]